MSVIQLIISIITLLIIYFSIMIFIVICKEESKRGLSLSKVENALASLLFSAFTIIFCPFVSLYVSLHNSFVIIFAFLFVKETRNLVKKKVKNGYLVMIFIVPLMILLIPFMFFKIFTLNLENTFLELTDDDLYLPEKVKDNHFRPNILDYAFNMLKVFLRANYQPI